MNKTYGCAWVFSKEQHEDCQIIALQKYHQCIAAVQAKLAFIFNVVIDAKKISHHRVRG